MRFIIELKHINIQSKFYSNVTQNSFSTEIMCTVLNLFFLRFD